jgi:cobalamin biosynthesis protein CobD/CbiB
MDFIVVLFAAIIGDLIWGNKKNFSERLNYPVIVFRRFIDFIDREFNRDEFSDNTKVFNGTIIT